MVIDSSYIPKAEISELWNDITGDSYIVDIREVNLQGDIRKVAAYLTKYISKASSWEGINLDMLEGFHLVGSWGIPPKTEGKPICPCGSYRKLARLSREDYLAQLWIPNEMTPSQIADRFGDYLLIE